MLSRLGKPPFLAMEFILMILPFTLGSDYAVTNMVLASGQFNTYVDI